MRIGYACLTIGIPNAEFLTCKQVNANNEKMRKLIVHNLCSLDRVISYNIKNQIQLFRISSDLIPFGSSPVNSIKWWEDYNCYFKIIADKISQNNIRVSMHPGQYTVLNSKDSLVVNRSIQELMYHNKVLNLLEAPSNCKIILHIGGVYSDKKEAIKRFEENYINLDENLKRRIVIENDDKSYNISDVLEIGNKLNIPVVFDNLHNSVNPADLSKDDNYWILNCEKTWKPEDGTPKIHYSQQSNQKRRGSHSETIKSVEFLNYYNSLTNKNMDIMLEVKDKNISSLKCNNLIRQNGEIKELEHEWSRYKYLILERSQNDYKLIRELLTEKSNFPVNEFYEIIEKALEKEVKAGNFINAAEHIWGYFKDKADERERNTFFKAIEDYKNGKASEGRIKNQICRLSQKYKEKYLLNSYYFSQ